MYLKTKELDPADAGGDPCIHQCKAQSWPMLLRSKYKYSCFGHRGFVVHRSMSRETGEFVNVGLILRGSGYISPKNLTKSNVG